MALIRWNPWSIDRFFEDDFEMPTIPGLSRLAGQGLNLYETDDAIVAEAAVPGVPEDKIDVTVDDGVVRVVGAMEQTNGGKGKKRNFMSTLSSSYNYAFRLPQGIVAEEEPECSIDNGVLTMRFPKVQKTPPKRLKVTRKTKESKDAKNSK